MRIKKKLTSSYYKYELNLLAFLILCSMGFLSFIFQQVLGASTTGNLFYILTWLLLYVIIISMIFYRNNIIKAIITTDKSILLLLIYIFASLFWAVNIEKSFISFGSLVLTCFIGIIIPYTYSPENIFIMIRKVSIWGINLTLLFLIVSKDLMYSELGFGSIYMHKNHAGFYYALSSIVFIYSSIFKGKNKKLDLCYFFISFSFLIHTSSSLALLNFLSAVSILFIIKLLKINYYVIIASLISIYFGVYFMILEPVMRFLGKSFTFTGRTVIWSESLNILFEKAYLGYGYASFFGDGPNFPSNRLHDMFVYYFAPNLHNGYLEVISQLGFLGLIIVLYIFSKSLRKIKNSRNIENNYRPFFFVLLSMILIENIGESVLMVHNHFITIFIIYLVNFTISTENKNFCLLYK